MSNELTPEEQKEREFKISGTRTIKTSTPLEKLELRERTLKYYKDLLNTRNELSRHQGSSNFNRSKIDAIDLKLDELAEDL
jgi:hypothetical protein